MLLEKLAVKIYEETASGAKAERPILDGLISHVGEGDVLIIWKLDRLGRSLKNLVDIINLLSQKKVGLQSLSDPVDLRQFTGV